jgi:hypothetical protein
VGAKRRKRSCRRRAAKSLDRFTGAPIFGGVPLPLLALPTRTGAKRRRSATGQPLRKKIGLIVPTDLMLVEDNPMAMTVTERSRVLRERRARGKVVLTVVLGEDELAEIAKPVTAVQRRRIARSGKRPSTCS